MSKKINNFSALITLVTVFFFWGFIAASNGVFIPFCKDYFSLNQFQSQLIDSAFYGAYYIGGFFLFMYSSYHKKDLINNWGYKKSIIYGLLISVIGALLMIPAINIGSFELILLALFILASGFCLQQTSANPFTISLGPKETGSHRLNFAGGINSLGTTIGPIVLSLLLFGGIHSSKTDIYNINLLYLFVAILFILIAIFLHYSKNLPNTVANSQVANTSKTNKLFITLTFSILIFTILSLNNNIKNSDYLSTITLILMLFFILYIISKPLFIKNKNLQNWGAMKYPQLILGMIAIFCYVGVEVTIQSNLGALLKTSEFGNISESKNSHFIAMYWGSLMIGRWLGAITIFNPSKLFKNILFVIIPYIAFMIVLFFIDLRGSEIDSLKLFSICILIQILGFLLGKEQPIKTLLIFSILAIIAMLYGIFTTGIVSIYAFLSGGLFCSIMWPCIFSLSIAGLKNYTSQGSSFLIMMILGGAVIPPLQGKIADIWSIHNSYIITVFCFLYIVFFAIKIKSVLKHQGINYEIKLN
ncbi:MAG: MFS transporter [Flavobacteriales bacterium]|nr:MFS transporter [Flavobacteriales bacterium]